MNRSAYFTTGLAVKLLSRLSRASIEVYGKENIPAGPTIFVMNHFTRIETFLLPTYFQKLTGKPALSLAASSLFKGGLETFLTMVGAVSTSDPKRDELIVKSLLTGEANWIIFPEGKMVKTKKIMQGGKFMVASATGSHEPHTGAAALALRAELYRRYLLDCSRKNPEKLTPLLESLGLESIDEIQREQVTIQPVNLTYYPIRAAENIGLDIASKLVDDIPDRVAEEIMAEGTMLFSGVDLDIRCGKVIEMAEYLDEQWLQEEMALDGAEPFSVSTPLKEKMRKTAYDVMQRYMQAIYAMTTVNHDHFFASFLRKYPFRRIEELDFKRRVFLGTIRFRQGERKGKGGALPSFLHKSLKGNQAHLLTDDRYGKYENFLELAIEKGIVSKKGRYLFRDRNKLSVPLSFHKGRITNPIEIIANEVEPLLDFQAAIRALAWQSETLLRLSLIRILLKEENNRYLAACERVGGLRDEKKKSAGKPFLLSSYRRKIGVVLIHSYLAVPEEVKGLARYLRRRGYWVYAPRLPGHGTSAEDLSETKYKDWVETVENGFVLMDALCDRVAVGGIAMGGNLALDLAARVAGVAGVFALCPPFSLRNYSTKFMPGTDVWNRILSKMKPGDPNSQFFEFVHGNLHVNYPRNPVAGVKEIGDYLESIEKSYGQIEQPALLIQADKNPVVDPQGSRQLYEKIGSTEKEFCLLSYDRHVLVNGERAETVFGKISRFLKRL